jgi:AcrR family transcriptional regulator
MRADLQSMQELVKIDEIGLRDRKKRRTRQAIRAAAIDLFTQQGVEATTIEQIASAADISPRTFFNYFESKEQAVSLPYGLRHEAALAPVTGDAWTAIVTSCLALAAALEADETERSTLIAGVKLCQHEPVLQDQASLQRGRWEALMSSAVESTLPNRVLVNAAAGAVWASLSDWADADGAGTLVGRVQESLRLIRS